MQINTRSKTILADTLTPVTAYLRIRDRLRGCLLLESADYQPGKNALSYLCAEPIAHFKVVDEQIFEQFAAGAEQVTKITNRQQVKDRLIKFTSSFVTQENLDVPYAQGVFGYTAYDAVRYFEDVNLKTTTSKDRQIPDLFYQAFRFVLVFNHFKDELTIIENLPLSGDSKSTLTTESLEYLLFHGDYSQYPFKLKSSDSKSDSKDEVDSNFTEEEFLSVINKCKSHIQRGDVFQIVPSRRYSVQYRGDDFSLYRALRSINPSPYLFYFDYGNFKIFGSSPEAQVQVSKNKATLFPIAGTYLRTHNDKEDNLKIQQLINDEKESAEHIMLVDLARNDLSRHCYPVSVEEFKEVQLYSHVIHLTSKVSGEVNSKKGENPIATSINIFADTFPMGTLSGAPKHRAMQLIDEFENSPRRAYGGAIGFFGFDGTVNHAIIIRSFHAEGGRLHFQAGAGIVSGSDPTSEANEVRNKLMALRQALVKAEGLKQRA